MSVYVDFIACVSDFVKQFQEFAKNNKGGTVGDFFNHHVHVNFVNDLVVTYHEEVFASGNNFLAPERVPAGIVTLAKKRGVKFPRGFSIIKDERACDMFLISVNDYRESRNLTKKRVKEIRAQKKARIGE